MLYEYVEKISNKVQLFADHKCEIILRIHSKIEQISKMKYFRLCSFTFNC